MSDPNINIPPSTDLPVIIYVDVDDTLIRSYGTKRIPIPAVIKHIREIYEQGAVLYCWSSGGSEYARRSAEEFGIADCFVTFLPKPNILLDDQDIMEWRRFSQIRPANCVTRTVKDYQQDIQ